MPSVAASTTAGVAAGPPGDGPARKRWMWGAVPAMSGVLVVYSSCRLVPYVGSMVNTAMLELAPVALLFAGEAGRRHVGILTLGACLSLYVLPDPQQQAFLSYPTYLCLVLVLAVQTSAVAKLRPTDALLVATIGIAVLSVLLLRHVLAYQLRLVQSVELVLLVLCMCTYGFLQQRIEEGERMLPTPV